MKRNNLFVIAIVAVVLTAACGQDVQYVHDGRWPACDATRQGTCWLEKPDGSRAFICSDRTMVSTPGACFCDYPSGARWDGNVCIDPDGIMQCYPGTHLSDGGCVADPMPPPCRAGTHVVDGGCEADLVPPMCHPGTHAIDGGCDPDTVDGGVTPVPAPQCLSNEVKTCQYVCHTLGAVLQGIQACNQEGTALSPCALPDPGVCEGGYECRGSYATMIVRLTSAWRSAEYTLCGPATGLHMTCSEQGWPCITRMTDVDGYAEWRFDTRNECQVFNIFKAGTSFNGEASVTRVIGRTVEFSYEFSWATIEVYSMVLGTTTGFRRIMVVPNDPLSTQIVAGQMTCGQPFGNESIFGYFIAAIGDHSCTANRFFP